MEGGQWRRRQREKVEVQEKGRRWVYCSLIDSFFFFLNPPTQPRPGCYPRMGGRTGSKRLRPITEAAAYIKLLLLEAGSSQHSSPPAGPPADAASVATLR